MSGENEETMGDGSLEDDAAFLAGNDESELAESVPEVPETPQGADEQAEGKTEETDKSDDTDSEIKESDESETEEKLPPVASDIAKNVKGKYPELFKEFPEVRRALFDSEQYRSVFPTLDSAKEAAGQVEQFQSLAESLIQNGDPEPLLDSIHDTDPKAVVKFVDNLVPTLYKKSPQLFQRMIEPVIDNILTGMRQEAIKLKGSNLEAARALYKTAQNLNQYLRGTSELPKGQQRPPEDPEKVEMARQLQAHNEQRHESFYSGLKTEAMSSMRKQINEFIDAEVSEGLRNVIIEKTIAEVEEKLKANKTHMELLGRLNKQAVRNGYDPQSRKTIYTAYMANAKAIIGPIRAKWINEITGTTPKAPTTKALPAGNGARGGTGKITAKTVDWSKVKSDADFLAMDNVPLKRR